MANFVQTSNTSATAYTLASGETGYVGQAAVLSLIAGDVITMSGGSGLIVHGDIFALSGNAVDGTAVGTFADIYVADGGSVMGGTAPAIDVAAGRITNYGEIQTSSGFNSIVGRTGSFDVVNYGAITTDIGSFALGYSGAGIVRYFNYGNITGNIGGDSGMTAFNVLNTGILTGNVSDFSNIGSVVRNSRLITGLVELRGGGDFFDGDGGRVLGVVRGEDGNDTLMGGNFADNMDGGAGLDRLLGRGGDDTLVGGLDNDVLFGGDNNDSLVGGGSNDYLDGQGEDDEVYGGDNNDTLFGNHGNDYLDGQGENDLIDGGFGNDIIRGNIGQDQMVGGAGSDTMTGGVGDDQFRFFASDLENGRRDVITDFAEAGGNADLLVFFDGIAASNITTIGQGADTIVRITFAGGTAVHEIVIENFLPAQIADQLFYL